MLGEGAHSTRQMSGADYRRAGACTQNVRGEGAHSMDDRDRLTEMSFATRIASGGLRSLYRKLASVWSCLIPNSITRLSAATFASALADSTSS